ncbi:MAG: PAS domain-containing protein [Chlorobiaceae bacterium]|nr:PAS domain-containing protein [Chlorobiaceae bacterium]
MEPDGLILNINTMFASRFGKQPKECINTNIYDLILTVLRVPMLVEHLREKCALVLNSGTRRIFEDDTDIWKISINPVLSAEGDINSLLIIIQNISEEKMIDRKLQKEREMKTALLDAIPCSATIMNADLHLIAWNRYAHDMLFSSTDEKSPLVAPVDFFGSNDMAYLRKKFLETLNTGVDDYSEIEVRPHGSTEPFWLMTRSKRVQIDGKPCLVSIGIDITERKKIEEDLNKYQTRLTLAMQAAHSGVWEWNPKTDEEYWSDDVWKLYGLERKNSTASVSLWKNAVHPEDRDRIMQSISETATNNGDLNAEYRVCHADGSVHWLMSRGKPVFMDDGQIDRYIGTITDITERKKLELDLIESKIRFGYALDASHSGIWEWNAQTDELSWSDQVWTLYGIKPNSEPLNHQLCVDTVHPEDREMVSRVIKDAVSSGNAASVEYRVCRPDDSVRWLTSRGMPLRDPEGRVIRYIGAIIDITERKQIELELIQNKARLSHALEAAQAGVWEWDLSTGENSWSDEIWPLYGLEPRSENPTFELWANTIHPDDRDYTITTVTETASSDIELNVEYRVCYPDGSIHWLMSRGKPFRDNQGNKIRYIGTVIDITKRKEAENRHIETQARYDFALEATNTGVWEWDLKADTVIWSDRIWTLYDMAPHSMPHSHKLCATHVHPEDQEITFMNVLGAASRNMDINVEYRVRHRNGSIHWLKCRGVPMKNADGETICYRGTVMDITERKLKDEELRKSQERLNFVLQKSHLGVWDLDLISRIAHQTQEHAHIFGYEKPLDDWSFDKFLGHVMQDDRDWVEALIQKAFEKQENYTFECRIVTVHGKLRWIWVFGAFDLNMTGNPSRQSGIVQDITDRKNTELLLRDSELKFRNIFEFSPIAIAIKDTEDGQLLDVNSSWLKLFDLSREEVIGRRIKDLGLYGHPDDQEIINQMLLEQGRITNSKFEFRKKSGQLMEIMFSAEYITMNGKTCLLVMLTDITLQLLQQANIYQLENAVAERTRQLQQEVERLRRFLSMISHEYRTPLAIIRGNLDLIDLKQNSPTFSNSAELNKIKRAIDRLVEVMEVSIQESRILESYDSVDLARFQIAPLITSQVEAFEAMWPERSILYSEHFGSAETIGEPAHLKMAIFNLLDNARKYSRKDSPIELDCRIDNEEAIITIRNQGESITRKEAKEFFDKYRRGSNAVNTAGAGLGLWLVKNIIEQHHGHVSLKGIEYGVEAKVRLPLTKDID